jgi:hypothetical protein
MDTIQNKSISTPFYKQSTCKPGQEEVSKDCVDLNSTQPKKDLTILFYMNGQYSDTGALISNRLLALEKSASADNINLVAQLGRTPRNIQTSFSPQFALYSPEYPIDNNWSGVRRYEIQHNDHPEFDRPTIEDLLDIEKEIPNNPCLELIIATRYHNLQNPEKSKVYFEKAKLSGLEEYLSGFRRSQKSLQITKEYQDHVNKIYEMKKSDSIYKSKMLQDLGQDAKMGDSAQLQDFIRWGMEKYPAKSYVVVMMGHGSAWKGALDMTSEQISKAIQRGVSDANHNTGENDKINLLIFNSCLMGNIEAAVEMKDAADISIISEEVSTGINHYDWDFFLEKIQNDIKDGNNFEPRKFAEEYVEFFGQRREYEEKNKNKYICDNNAYPTLTAVDNKKLDELVASIKKFSVTCKENNVCNKDIFRSIGRTHTLDSGNPVPLAPHGYKEALRDLGIIFDKLIDPRLSEGVPEPVIRAAKDVLKSLDNTIIKEQHTKEGEKFKTLTVFAPDNYFDFIHFLDEYIAKTPEFSKNSGWLDLFNEASTNLPVDVKGNCKKTLNNIKEITEKGSGKNLSKEERISLMNAFKNEVIKSNEERIESSFINY